MACRWKRAQQHATRLDGLHEQYVNGERNGSVARQRPGCRAERGAGSQAAALPGPVPPLQPRNGERRSLQAVEAATLIAPLLLSRAQQHGTSPSAEDTDRGTHDETGVITVQCRLVPGSPHCIRSPGQAFRASVTLALRVVGSCYKLSCVQCY